MRALTHRSLAHELAQADRRGESLKAASAAGDNERLEFLGDAVLGLVVAEALFAAASGVARRRADARSSGW